MNKIAILGAAQKTRAERLQPTQDGGGDALPRRLSLRSTRGTRCCLLPPLALPGCDASGKAQLSKASQAGAQYQAQPNGAQSCAGCIDFLAETNACRAVEGSISAAGSCVLWSEAPPWRNHRPEGRPLPPPA